MTATPTAGYPLHWEADVLLADGGVAHLRPSGPADAEAIRAMHGRSSAKTLYMRYFSAVSDVSDQQIEVFTDVDYDSRVGLVAVLGGADDRGRDLPPRPVRDTDAAEAAFLVEDSQQGRGLGSILLEHLAAAARERGIRRSPPRCSARTPRCSGCSWTPGTPCTASTTPVSSTWRSTSNRPRSPGR